MPNLPNNLIQQILKQVPTENESNSLQVTSFAAHHSMTGPKGFRFDYHYLWANTWPYQHIWQRNYNGIRPPINSVTSDDILVTHVERGKNNLRETACILVQVYDYFLDPANETQDITIWIREAIHEKRLIDDYNIKSELGFHNFRDINNVKKDQYTAVWKNIHVQDKKNKLLALGGYSLYEMKEELMKYCNDKSKSKELLRKGFLKKSERVNMNPLVFANIHRKGSTKTNNTNNNTNIGNNVANHNNKSVYNIYTKYMRLLNRLIENSTNRNAVQASSFISNVSPKLQKFINNMRTQKMLNKQVQARLRNDNNNTRISSVKRNLNKHTTKVNKFYKNYMKAYGKLTSDQLQQLPNTQNSRMKMTLGFTGIENTLRKKLRNYANTGTFSNNTQRLTMKNVFGNNYNGPGIHEETLSKIYNYSKNK